MEIQDFTQSFRFVSEKDAPFLPPSALQSIATKALPNKHLHAIMYNGKKRSAQAIFYSFDPSYYYLIYIDPYTGSILESKNMEHDFFRFILNGHYYLWLPPAIGQPLAASATLIFVFMLITGIVLWWPKNKNGRKQRLVIKWNARWRRKNFDLHSVLGFYVFAISLLLASTGLVWGFQWFGEAVYFLSGGEKTLTYIEPLSTKNYGNPKSTPSIDLVWDKMNQEYPSAESIEVHPPTSDSSAIAANANPDVRTFWKINYRYFDQHTLEELPAPSIYGQLKNADAADKLMRLNYDIHVGGVLGLPGKIIMFIASLICASLPITGFLLWYGKRNKNKGTKFRGINLSKKKTLQ